MFHVPAFIDDLFSWQLFRVIVSIVRIRCVPGFSNTEISLVNHARTVKSQWNGRSSCEAMLEAFLKVFVFLICSFFLVCKHLLVSPK